MNTAKEILYNLIEQIPESEIPESEIPEIIDFIRYLKSKKEKEIYKDLQKASESSLEFWDNELDDEVWNDV